MILSPKKTKYRKAFKGRISGVAAVGSSLHLGSFALKAQEPHRIKGIQIEAARRAIRRRLNRAGKLWIRIFPDIPVSKKPAEVRMGGGKGSVDHYIFRVKPGRILFEVDGVPEDIARSAFELAASKLPIKTKFVKRMFF